MKKLISKEVKEVHQFLREYWDRKNKGSQFEDLFSSEFNEHQPDLKEGDAVKFSLDIMITMDELELLMLFCKKYNVVFSISPSLDQTVFSFHIQDFNQRP